MVVGVRDKADTQSEADPDASRYALVLDFEEVVVPTQQAEFDALRQVLASRKVEFTPALYVRHALHREPRQYLPKLLAALGVRTNTVDTMADEVQAGIHMYLTSSADEVPGVVQRLIDLARKRGMTCAVRTRYTEDAARGLLSQRTGAPQDLPVLSVEPQTGPTPGISEWRVVSQLLQRTPAHIIAVVSGQPNLQAALAAGMHSIAVPNPFTAFQDFSGADCVIDDPAEWEPEMVLARWK